MTPDELIEQIVERYYERDLPEAPDERLVALRDIVLEVWESFGPDERVALAAELDETEDAVGFAGADPHVSAGELAELDEQAVDGITARARLEIPELSPGDSTPMP